MRRLRIVLAGVVVLGTALVVAAIAIIKSIDINEYRGDIAQAVKEATGRNLVIDGEMDLEISLEPTVVVSDVSFSNPSGMSRAAMATLRRLEAKVELLPLISGDVRVRYVVLEGLDLRLERNAEGVANWVVDPQPESPPEVESGAASLPVVQEIRVRDVALTYLDAISGERYALNLESVDLSSQSESSPLIFMAKGRMLDMPFVADGQLPSVVSMTDGDAFPLKLNVGLGSLVLGIDGVVAQPRELEGISFAGTAKTEELAMAVRELAALAFDSGAIAVPEKIGPFALSMRVEGSAEALSASDIDLSLGTKDTLLVAAKGGVVDLAGGAGFDLRLTIEGRDLSGFSDLAGSELPKDKPFSITGRFSDGDDAFGIDGLSILAGNSALSGWITVTMTDPRPMLEAQLLADIIDFNDFPFPIGSEATPQTPRDRVFSADPLPLEAMKQLDADIDFQAKRVVTGGMFLSDIATGIVLDDGSLSVKPLKAGIAGGRVEGSLSLDVSQGSNAKLAMEMSLTGAQAGQLVKELAGEDVLEGGPMDVNVKLTGAGDSQQTLVASLDGELRVSIGKGRLRNGALDAMGADIAMQALNAINPFAGQEAQTELNCAAMRFAFGGGKAVADKGIAAETSKMIVVGSGVVDLRSEEIDFTIKPEAREGLGLNIGGIASIVRVSGTLAQPEFGLNALEAGKTALSVGAAIATGGISLLAEGLVNRLTASSEPCRTALGLAPADRASPPVSPGAAPAPSAPAEQPESSGGVKGFLGGFGKSLDKTFGQ